MDQSIPVLLFLLGSGTSILVVSYLTQKIRLTRQCPRCGDRHPERVGRKGLLKYTPFKAYHCCGQRFYRLSLGKKTGLYRRSVNQTA